MICVAGEFLGIFWFPLHEVLKFNFLGLIQVQGLFELCGIFMQYF